jgi:hypothetical protein
LADESGFHDGKSSHFTSDPMPKRLASIHLSISQQLMQELEAQVLRAPNNLALLNKQASCVRR